MFKTRLLMRGDKKPVLLLHAWPARGVRGHVQAPVWQACPPSPTPSLPVLIVQILRLLLSCEPSAQASPPSEHLGRLRASQATLPLQSVFRPRSPEHMLFSSVC